MKAYAVRRFDEFDSIFCYAESANTAKAQCMSEFDAEYIDMRARRLPHLDCRYSGESKIDWYDMENRYILVRDYGFTCGDYADSGECKVCKAKVCCATYKDMIGDSMRSRDFSEFV